MFTLSQLRPASLTVALLMLSACSTTQTLNPPVIEEQSSPFQPAIVASEEPTQSSWKTTPPEQPEPVDDIAPEVKNSVPMATVTSTPVHQNQAVVALLSKAQQQQQRGDYRSAQTNLQRAQRISPRDPEIYYELANIHLELNDYALAEQVALKGVSIVQGQSQELKKFWLLIAQIRELAGNAAGARQARHSASKY